MALNSSGPLSFGGATTGQSINLELGVSATATASINSTSFRTLAGVPSGQISVSNFYGKSNSIGWIAYIGDSTYNATFGYIFESYQQNTDSLGNTYYGFRNAASSSSPNNYSGLRCINKDATLLASKNMWSFSGSAFYAAAVPPLQDYGTTADVLILSSTSDLAGFPHVSTGTDLVYKYTPRTGNGGQTNANGSYRRAANGNYWMSGKNSGEQHTVYAWRGSDGVPLYQYIGGYSYTPHPVPRSDSSVIMIRPGYTGYYTDYEFCVAPAAGGSTTNGHSFRVNEPYTTSEWHASAGDGTYGFVAANNGNNGVIARVDPSGGGGFIAKVKNFNIVGGGMACAGGYVYVITETGALSAYDTSLNPQWRLTFTFSAGACNLTRINANSEGIFMRVQRNTAPNNQFVLKIPLTGLPTSSSVALTGPSGITFSWTRSTFTAGSISASRVGGFSINYSAGFGSSTRTSSTADASTYSIVKTNI